MCVPDPRPQDDPRIPNDEAQYRAIHHDQIKRDGRVSSGAFGSRNVDDHPSVERSGFTSPQQTLARKPRSSAVAQILAGQIRKVTAGVAWAPLPGNRAHALIIRRRTDGSAKWKRIRKELARRCSWAIPPPLRVLE